MVWFLCQMVEGQWHDESCWSVFWYNLFNTIPLVSFGLVFVLVQSCSITKSVVKKHYGMTPPTSIRGVGTRWSLMSVPPKPFYGFYDMLSNHIFYYFHLPFQAFIGFFKLLFQKRTPEFICNLSHSRSSGSIKSYVIFLGSCLKVSGSGTAPANPRFIVELSALWRCQHCARRPAAMAQQICISKCVWGRP